MQRVYFTLGSSVGYDFKFKSLKLGPQKWTQYWNSSLRQNWVLDFSVEFNFGVFIKMNFVNKIVQTLVSFVSTKFVLHNGAIDWKVCWIINH